MNEEHLNAICLHFNLDSPKQNPTRVHGGLLHAMWRLDTDEGFYAIKQLSRNIDLSNPIEQVNQTIETILRLKTVIPRVINKIS